MRFEELERMYRLEDRYWWFVGRRELVRALMQRFAPPTPRTLDVGCGTGGTLDALRGLGETVGADLSEDALEFCRQRGHRDIVRCRAEALCFSDGTFDAAVCCDVIEHLDDDGPGLAEIHRLLKPGGLLVATVPAYKWLWSQHDVALSHRRRYEKRELRKALQENGFEVVKLTFSVSLTLPIVVLVRLLSRAHLRKLGQPHTQLMTLPGWLNTLFLWVQRAETWWVCRAGFPWGTSLVAVAVRSDADSR